MPADPYRYFRIEARELLDQLGEGILALERGANGDDVVPRLLRDAHTLKGAARVVRLAGIAEDAHALEDLLGGVQGARQGGGTPADAARTHRMLALVDHMRAQLANLAAPGLQAGSHAQAEAPTKPATPAGDRLHVFRPDPGDIDDVARGLSLADAALGRLDDALQGLDHARRLLAVLDDKLSMPAFAGRSDDGRALEQDGLRAITSDVRRRLGVLHHEGIQALERASREVGLAADATARLRLAPARGMFRFLERATRDAAHAEGKRVRFDAHGGDIRLEPEMLGVLQAACLHLVRNAVVHGIESEPGRRAAGKPVEGTVRVAVERNRNHVSVCCQDDGAGIAVERVREAFERRGLPPPDSSGPDGLLRLLLESGVTTVEAVTPLAGRGIGLGVVREAASRLGGHVDIRTKPGQGTTVELVVPFALASLPALLVEAAGVPAALPLDAIGRVMTVEERHLARSARGASLVADGRSVPVGTLHQIVAPERVPPPVAGRSALLVRSGERSAALVVDRILQATTLTVRPLPDLAPARPAVVGASIDPSGRPRLVLDPQALVDAASSMAVVADAPPAQPDAILVVDDSLTTRMLEQSILESAGYVVGLASSGEEALEKVRSGAYALCLVDVEMPGMDGFTFVQRVRADPQIGRTPIVLVTSRDAPADRDRGRSVGANAYIVKSEFDQHTLLKQIRTLIEA